MKHSRILQQEKRAHRRSFFLLLFVQIFFDLFSGGKGRNTAHTLYADSSGSISVPESLFYDVLGKISLRGDAAHEDPGKETAPESVSMLR